jgi:hypothetical protein
VLPDFDFIRATSAADLQLTPASATLAPGSLTQEESLGAGPITAAPAPEGTTPAGLAPEVDAALPDLPPPELQQVEAEAGGEVQVEAPDAAPTDGTGKLSTAPG